jgi:hypothetical protein
MGFAARVHAFLCGTPFRVQIFSHRAAAGLHRPDPIMIVVTPSFVVELAFQAVLVAAQLSILIASKADAALPAVNNYFKED